MTKQKKWSNYKSNFFLFVDELQDFIEEKKNTHTHTHTTRGQLPTSEELKNLIWSN